MTLRSPFEWLDDPTSVALEPAGVCSMSHVEQTLPDCFSRDPMLRPVDVHMARRPHQDASNSVPNDQPVDMLDLDETDLVPITLQSNRPVEQQTVPRSSDHHPLDASLPLMDLEIGQLRSVARSRRGVVGSVPTVSQGGRHGLTPQQQFTVIACTLFTSTFGMAFVVANFLP